MVQYDENKMPNDRLFQDQVDQDDEIDSQEGGPES